MDEYKTANKFDVYAAITRHEMLPFIPANARTILDVGCSTGNFGESIKSQRTAEIWGVEIDQQAAEIASEKLDKVICGGFEPGLNLPEEKFDCIVFNDVL